jgi:hypothetical protein
VRNRLNACSGSKAGGKARAFGNPRVGVEHAAAALFELDDTAQVSVTVNSAQFLVRSLANQATRAAREIPGPLEVAQNRLEPFGSLGMAARNAVINHAPIRE